MLRGVGLAFLITALLAWRAAAEAPWMRPASSSLSPLVREAVDLGPSRRNLSRQRGQPRFRVARELIDGMEGGELLPGALAIRPQFDQRF